MWDAGRWQGPAVPLAPTVSAQQAGPSLLRPGTGAWPPPAASGHAAAPAAGQPPGPPPGQGRVIWCGQEIGPPAKLPPAGSGPVVCYIGVCFPEQGDVSVIEPETYLYYIQTKSSIPSENGWVPWTTRRRPTR